MAIITIPLALPVVEEVTEMVERVARAMYEDDRKRLPDVETLPWEDFEVGQADYLSSARAAIEAMREPTEAMLFFGHENDSIRAAWISMIDAALGK